MKNNIKKILLELYEIDESLKNKEKELLEIIDKVLKYKPNINPSEDFKKTLKEQILQEINIQKIKNYEKSSKNNLLQIFSYIFGTAGIAAFLFVFYNENFLKNTQKVENTQNEDKFLSLENEIKENKDGFGNLRDNQKKETFGLGGNLNKKIQFDNALPNNDLENTDYEIFKDDIILEESDTENDEVLETRTDIDESINLFSIQETNDISNIEKVIYNFTGSLDIDLEDEMPVYKKEKTISLNPNYLKLDYEIENEEKNILKLVSLGGKFITTSDDDENTKYITKNIKNPVLRYVFTRKKINGEIEEIFVPAIIFEIENSEDILEILLVKDFYKYDEDGNIIGNN